MSPGTLGCTVDASEVSACLDATGLRKAARNVREAYNTAARLYNACRDPSEPPVPYLRPTVSGATP